MSTPSAPYPGNPYGGPVRATGRTAPSTFADKVRATVRGVGEVLITLGLVLLLFCGYQLFWTDLTSSRATNQVLSQLDDQFAAGGVTSGVPPKLTGLVEGQPFARLYIPRLGKNYVKPIIEGTNLDDLHKGVGHYLGTALPGEVGNFAIAGHRVTNGHPFRNMDKFENGDQIFVETKDAWYTYEITQTQLVVKPQDVWVIDPVPGQPGAAPTEAIMTMTTCHPPFSARERMVTFAKLTDTRLRSDGPPAGAPPVAG